VTGFQTCALPIYYPENTLSVNEDKMIQGNLKLFGLLTKWVLGEAKRWISDANK